MKSTRWMRPDGVVCFALSLLICCGESPGGGSDAGTGPAGGDVAAESLEAWGGSASGVIGGALVDGLETSVEITWVADPEQPVAGQTAYSARGRVSYRSGGCAVTPADESIESHSVARLIIDWTRSPPEYSASGASMWIASMTCGGSSADAPVGGVWLADPSTVDQTARGVLTAAKTMEGSASFGDPRAVQFTFQWAFRKAN